MLKGLTGGHPHEPELFFSSVVAFAGLTVARLLGFLFSVTAARLLAPADYGRMAYAVAIAGMASVLLSSSPTGLSRFLARESGDRARQNSDFSNWLGIVFLLLAASILLMAPVSAASGLRGWIVVGVGVNLVGTAVLETYREAQRGMGRYGLQAVFYSLANMLQLTGIIVAAALGWRSPALFVILYGCSGLLACLLMEMTAPVGLRFLRAALASDRMLMVLRFIWPLLLQSVFFAVWFGADLVLVQRLLPAAATGNYAAAKTLANAVWMAPAAISMVLLPRVARLPVEALRRQLPGFVGGAVLVTLPAAVALALLGRWLIRALFGDAYPDAAAPVALLGLGMAMHGLYLVFFSVWVGLGRPLIDLVATATATACTVAVAFVAIPHAGLVGAATAFGLGAAVRLGVISAFTAWALYIKPARFGLGTVAVRMPETPMVAAPRGRRDSLRWDGDAADA
jgi:O-antigen/teichoic acid export membrane protein